MTYPLFAIITILLAVTAISHAAECTWQTCPVSDGVVIEKKCSAKESGTQQALEQAILKTEGPGVALRYSCGPAKKVDKD